MGTPLRTWPPVDEILAWERRMPERHEYVGGIIKAVVGGTVEHNTIAGNIFAGLRTSFAGGPCRAFIENVKVVTSHAFMYPDVVATCTEPTPGSDFVPSPVLIVEVLSSSTEEADRGRKWMVYQGIDSLQAYVLVAQDEISVELFARKLNGWDYAQYRLLDDVLSLPALDARLGLREIYARVVA